MDEEFWIHQRLRIGWNEHVDLPEWGIRGIRAKVDTGARTSALHVHGIDLRPHGRVRFDVVLDRGRRARHIETTIRRRGRVRSSTGHYTTRVFVATDVQIGPIRREVELSLVDRGSMLFRMLLGRTALAGPFLVDVNHSRLLGRRPSRRSRRS